MLFDNGSSKSTYFSKSHLKKKWGFEGPANPMKGKLKKVSN